jgi:hypothetical protein
VGGHLNLGNSNWGSLDGSWGSFNGDGSWGSLDGNWGSGVSECWGSSVSSVCECWGSLDSDGSWGSSVSDGWGSFSYGNGGSLGVSDGKGGSDSGGNLLVDGVAGLLNDGGLDNLVDWVDLVGLGNWVGLLDLNGVGLGNVGLVDDLSLDWHWVWNWDIDGNTVHLEFGLNASDSWGDLGVSADGSENLLLSDGVSWSGSKVARCWGDDGGSGCGNCWWGNWNSGLA